MAELYFYEQRRFRREKRAVEPRNIRMRARRFHHEHLVHGGSDVFLVYGQHFDSHERASPESFHDASARARSFPAQFAHVRVPFSRNYKPEFVRALDERLHGVQFWQFISHGRDSEILHYLCLLQINCANTTATQTHPNYSIIIMSGETIKKGKGRRKPGFVLVLRMEGVIMKVTRTDVEAMYIHDACAYLDTAIQRIENEREIHIVLCSASNATEVEAEALRHDLREYAFAKFIDRYIPGILDEELGDVCVEIAKANKGAYFAVIAPDKVIDFRPDIEEHIVKIPKDNDRYFGGGEDVDRLHAVATKGFKAFRCFEVHTENTYERTKRMHDAMSQYQSMLRLLEQLEAATANKEFKSPNDIMDDKVVVEKITPLLRKMHEDSFKQISSLFDDLKKAVDEQYAAIELSYSGEDDHDGED